MEMLTTGFSDHTSGERIWRVHLPMAGVSCLLKYVYPETTTGDVNSTLMSLHREREKPLGSLYDFLTQGIISG